MSHDIVSILDEDPDLGHHLPGPRLAAATRECLAEVISVPTGPWHAERYTEVVEHGYGLLVLDGALARRVGRQRRHGAELLGPGDVLRPADAENESLTTPFETAWRVIDPARLAILDPRFLQRAAPYPEIGACLVARAVSRARHVLVYMSIAHHARVDKRLELLLWHLAERFGRMTTQGVALPLRLTHELLADLVAAQRPSVTLSLQQLERAGRIARRETGFHLLGPPPGDDELEPLPARLVARAG